MNDLAGKIIHTSTRWINHARSLFYPTGYMKNYGSLGRKTYRDFNSHRPIGPLPKLCYAPWTNLFFNTHGNAMVCCKNTKVILGKYPEKSIHDIWFSSQREMLKKSINKNDLSLGCFKCKDSILQGNYSSTTSVVFDKHNMMPLKKYPRVIEFELSNKCNLECIMCSGRVSSSIQANREHQEIMKMTYDDNFVGQLDEFIPYLKEAKFTGGEPFLIPIYYKIWEKIEKINPSVKILIQTNGTILNDVIKKLIKKLHFQINVSIDSVNKDTYESIRRNADYEKMVNHVEWLGKNTQHLSVLATPFRMNWKDIPDIILFCNKNKYQFNISQMYCPGELALWSLDIDIIKEIIDYYHSIKLTAGNRLERHNIGIYEELIATLEYWIKCKEKNDEFNNRFLDVMNEQEPEIITHQTVNKSDIKNSKNTFRLILFQNGFTEIEFENFAKAIDEYCQNDKDAVCTELFYFHITQSHKPETIIKFYRDSSEYLIKEKLIEEHDVIKKKYSIV